jgi:hypothetical protein
VTVEGYTVICEGAEVDVAMTITIDGQVVQLRDPDTGAPLWLGLRGQGPMKGPEDTI